MLVNLDMAGEAPIYLQLRDQIVMGIGSGRLGVGQGLPTVRQLAEDLGVNPMTVAKSYTLLKDQGFIEIDRRQGAKVKVSPKTVPHFPANWREQLFLLLAEALARGMKKDEFLAECLDLFERISGGESQCQ